MTSRQRGAVLVFAVLALGRVLDRFDLPFERAPQGNGIPADSTLVPGVPAGARREDSAPPPVTGADSALSPAARGASGGQRAAVIPEPAAAVRDTVRARRAPHGAAVASPVVHVNRAAAAELQLLPGVGPVLAERILLYRRSHGAFRDLTDLRHVKGIGARTAERLSSCIRFD